MSGSAARGLARLAARRCVARSPRPSDRGLLGRSHFAAFLRCRRSRRRRLISRCRPSVLQYTWILFNGSNDFLHGQLAPLLLVTASERDGLTLALAVRKCTTARDQGMVPNPCGSRP